MLAGAALGAPSGPFTPPSRRHHAAKCSGSVSTWERSGCRLGPGLRPGGGLGFGFRFGPKDHPMIERYNEMLKTRLGKDPSGFTAAGDVEDMMALVGEFREAGVEKFILRPIARGTEEMLEQTRLFIDKLMPEIAALNS